MDHRVSKDMISSGMTPSGQRSQADLGRTQYGSAPSPDSLMDAYKAIYEHHSKDEDGNVIEHEDETLDEKMNPYKFGGSKLSAAQKEANKIRKKKAGLGGKGRKVNVQRRNQKMDQRGVSKPTNTQSDQPEPDQKETSKGFGDSFDLLAAYQSMYIDSFEEGKIPAGLQAYLDKKKGKKGGDDEDHGDEKKGKKGKKSKGGKPDFLDLDKDGDKKESMKKASKEMKEENLDEALPLLAAPLVAKGLVALKGGLAAAKATKAGVMAAKGIKAGAAALKAGGAAAKAGVKSGVKAGGQFAKGLTTAKPTGLSKITQSGGKLLGGSKVSAAQKAGAGLRSGLKSAATPTNALLATSMIPQGGGAAQPKPPKLYSDVDLFDIVQGILVNEGVEEKDTATMMLSITPEELQIIQDEINEIGEDVIIERLGLRTAQKALAKGSYYAQKADKAIDKAGGVKGAAKKLDKKYGIKDKLVGKTGAGMATRAAGVLGATYLKGRSDESESRRPSKNTGFSYYDKDF